ncbi:MAG: hypothetical protein ACE10K_10575 [Rhodothermales bacterium]
MKGIQRLLGHAQEFAGGWTLGQAQGRLVSSFVAVREESNDRALVR